MPTVQKPAPPKRRTPRRDARKVLSTRGGTTLVAVISALLAAGVLLIFLSQYRESVSAADDVSTVLVAKNLIEKGSPGDVVAEDALFQTTTVKKDDLKDGAISDPSNLKGKIATTDVFPGEQLVAKEFVAAAPGILNRLRGFDRAIAVPLDESHGMIGNIKGGDHVDVLAGIGLQQGASENRRATLRVIMHDALVLKAPDKPSAGAGSGPSSTKPVILRVSDRKASEIAFAADIGKVWLVARPKVGAKESRVPVTDIQSLAVGLGAKALTEADEYLEDIGKEPGR
ncbi:MAG TPA: Flp pilus assembly protein CpaB [Thermoleophilaceae bacterium]